MSTPQYESQKNELPDTLTEAVLNEDRAESTPAAPPPVSPGKPTGAKAEQSKAEGELIYCTDCGAPNRSTGRFCRKCGQTLELLAVGEEVIGRLADAAPERAAPRVRTAPKAPPPYTAPRRRRVVEAHLNFDLPQSWTPTARTIATVLIGALVWSVASTAVWLLVIGVLGYFIIDNWRRSHPRQR